MISFRNHNQIRQTVWRRLAAAPLGEPNQEEIEIFEDDEDDLWRECEASSKEVF
eukprot:TRINITY_DN4478_c0_g1_i1.p4 TRINITY_DN4478_c0_g1~~TRINITY_DN4478_c0_g1_i1.p4  ORF type:complete len:54 (-),score=13.34 TRINITY_DN4478_c0_g1_i1:83-244(-)